MTHGSLPLPALELISLQKRRRCPQGVTRWLRRLGGIHGGKKNAPNDSELITFSGTFSGTLVGVRSGAGRVREYRRDSGPFRECGLASNRADALSCRSLLQ